MKDKWIYIPLCEFIEAKLVLYVICNPVLETNMRGQFDNFLCWLMQHYISRYGIFSDFRKLTIYDLIAVRDGHDTYKPYEEPNSVGKVV